MTQSRDVKTKKGKEERVLSNESREESLEFQGGREMH